MGNAWSCKCASTNPACCQQEKDHECALTPGRGRPGSIGFDVGDKPLEMYPASRTSPPAEPLSEEHLGGITKKSPSRDMQASLPPPLALAPVESEAVGFQPAAGDCGHKVCSSQTGANDASTIADIDFFVGAWHRESDKAFMAYITADCNIVWASNLDERALLTETPTGLQMMLRGSLYTATAVRTKAEDAVVQLHWSDGEIWVRGFATYVGNWYSTANTQMFFSISIFGILSWNESNLCQLRIHPEGSLILVSGGASHTATLEEVAPGCTGPDGAPNQKLVWTDGDVWFRGESEP